MNRLSPAGEPTDRELLARARSGEPECFGLFYWRRRGVVLAFLRPRVATSELAADLTANWRGSRSRGW